LAEQSGKPYRAVINISDEWGRLFAAKAKGAVYTYGECECALVRAVRAEYGHDALRFWVRTALATGSALTPSPSPTGWARGVGAHGGAPPIPPLPTSWERGTEGVRAYLCTPR
jgi:hypothetical protein